MVAWSPPAKPRDLGRSGGLKAGQLQGISQGSHLLSITLFIAFYQLLLVTTRPFRSALCTSDAGRLLIESVSLRAEHKPQGRVALLKCYYLAAVLGVSLEFSLPRSSLDCQRFAGGDLRALQFLFIPLVSIFADAVFSCRKTPRISCVAVAQEGWCPKDVSAFVSTGRVAGIRQRSLHAKASTLSGSLARPSSLPCWSPVHLLI